MITYVSATEMRFRLGLGLWSILGGTYVLWRGLSRARAQSGQPLDFWARLDVGFIRTYRGQEAAQQREARLASREGTQADGTQWVIAGVAMVVAGLVLLGSLVWDATRVT